MEKKITREPLFGTDCEIINSSLLPFTELGAHTYLENVTMGEYSYTGPFCILQNTVVGKFANIAANVRIGPTNHPMERPTLHHITYRRRMFGVSETDDTEFLDSRRSRISTIGHDTWIGHGAIIMSNLQIGNGAVIGSGAVVTRDVEPYSIVVGNPARHLRYRFSFEIIEALEKIAWWDWAEDVLKNRVDDLAMPIDAFVHKYLPEAESRMEAALHG